MLLTPNKLRSTAYNLVLIINMHLAGTQTGFKIPHFRIYLQDLVEANKETFESRRPQKCFQKEQPIEVSSQKHLVVGAILEENFECFYRNNI